MPMLLRVSRALVRSLGPAFLLAVAFFGPVDSLFGATTGMGITKSCPATVPPGSAFQCTFTVQNLDPVGSVTSLAVTNQVPFPGGPIAPTACNQGGSPVTTLGPNGTPTDTCNGTIDETAPPCGAADAFFTDQIAATGNDGGPVFASTTNSVQILACTPTPTNTPTDTPTNTPTNTPTGTPTNTPTNTPTDTPTNTPTTPQTAPPTVPTLSFPMMALLGLLLAGAGLFLARRQ
jgi:hypothetical protein